MLATSKHGQLADLFATNGDLTIHLEVDKDGFPHTTYESRGMTYPEVWAVCEEIALACRLRRMGNWLDPREEIDSMGLEGKSSVYVNYTPHRQNFKWVRVNISYQDAEIACMITAEIAKTYVFPEGSIDPRPQETF